MKNRLKRMLSLLLAVLCMASFSITAFAAETGEDETETETVETVTEDADVEVNYSYVISEDGSITITIGGVVTEETTTTGTVVTNGGKLNLRTGAGMDYEIIDQLCPGDEVIVVGSEGDWYEVIIPEKTGYVHSAYLELMEQAEQNSDIDSALLNIIMEMLFEKWNTVTPDTDTGDENTGAFTPDGNLTLIDDYLQIEAEATEDTPQQEKQFITVQTKAGNYFYIVIDRNGDEENVYFLNLVDEADLFALMEDEDGETTTVTCTCSDKCVIGSINTSCEVCRTNMSECTGVETVVETETTTEPVADEEPDEDTDTSANFMPIIILLIAGGAGAAVYFFKFKKNKPKTSGDTDLDDYDFGEDGEDYDEETEIDDAEESED